MARISWGRDARLYVAPVVFDAGAIVELDNGDLEEVANLKDIGHTDEIAQLVATARDLANKVYDRGERDVAIEAEALISAATDDNAMAIIATSYTTGTPIWVLLTRAAKTATSGKGMLMVANVFGWPEKIPESGAITRTLQFKPSHPDSQPESVNTPFQSIPILDIPTGTSTDPETEVEVTIGVVDLDSTTLAVTLGASPSSSIISLGSTTGLTGLTGNNSDSVAFSGTVANVVAALTDLGYTPAAGFDDDDGGIAISITGLWGEATGTLTIHVNAA